jgi:hypothetical protein
MDWLLIGISKSLNRPSPLRAPSLAETGATILHEKNAPKQNEATRNTYMVGVSLSSRAKLIWRRKVF